MSKVKINAGFIYVTNYSFKFRKLIQSIAEKAERALPSKRLNEIGIFLFGSSSRQEMIDESDADIMIVRTSDNEDYELFRSEFIKLLEKENFSKLDVPDWGTLKDCESYLKYSIVEGNQVMESKFIYGDESINKKLQTLKDKYNTPLFFERVLCFQKLYFDQYYLQRTKLDAKNVKYGHGGTRDFMFVTIFANLYDVLELKRINSEDSFPLIYKSLGSFYERKLINFEDYMLYLDSINTIMILRNEILIQNKWTSNEGLTYLDDSTTEILFKRKLFVNESVTDAKSLKIHLEKHMLNIKEFKQRVWNLYIAHLLRVRGQNWFEILNAINLKKITREIIDKIDSQDEILQTLLIWGLDIEKEKEMFDYVFSKYLSSDKWTVLASMCCHKDCPSEILDLISKKQAIIRGYEYILRIISRNRNVSTKTLKDIINNPDLEDRWKIVSRTAYEKGVQKANELR